MASTGVDRITGVDPSVAIKAPCGAASASNITLSGAQTIDGVAVTETTPKTRVLVTGQASAIENGIYDVYTTAWVRSEDFNGSRDVVDGTLVSVDAGTTYANTTWKVVAANPVTPGTTSIAFVRVNNFDSAIQSVATIADLRLVTGVTAGQVFNVNGIGTFEAVTGSLADDGQLYVETDNGVICKILNARITGDATVTVPTYYATIQAALDDLYPRVIFDTSHTVTINIETGHVLTAGFRIDNGDYSGFTLSSTDATVTVSPAFTPVSTTDLDPGVPRTARNAFVAVRAKMPKWNIKVNMAGPAIANGYTLLYGSHGYVVSYMGVINTSDSPSSTSGVNCRVAGSSDIDAYRGAFDSANDTGISVTQNSKAQIAEATATNCIETGLDISRGSHVYANLINVSGSKEGIYIRRSECVAQLANLNGCTSIGLWAALGSKVIISDSTFDDPAPSLNRIRIEDGSNVSATGCTKNGSALVASDTNVPLFNQSTGNGIIYNQASPVTSIPALNASSTAVQIVSADNQTIATLTYQTIFDLTGSMVLYGGTIYGNDVGFRLTVDGTVVATDVTRARGVDSAANFISVCMIPPAIAASTMKLEAYNRAGGASALGWKVYKQGGV